MKKYQKLIALVLVLIFIMQIPASALSNFNAKVSVDEIANNRIIIKYHSQKAKSEMESKNKKLPKAKSKKSYNNQLIDVIELSSNDIKDKYLEFYNSEKKNVEYAVKDELLISYGGTSTEINDAIEKLHIDNSYQYGTGEDVLVGVLDTGINYHHKALKGVIDNRGYDFANDNSSYYDFTDDESHGTAVAGIIASQDSKYIGASPNVKILPLKFMINGKGYTSDAIEAIEYANSLGVKVINCSFGSTEYNYPLKEVMEKSNIVFVCASGNNETVYPAGYNSLPNVISVGAVDSTNVPLYQSECNVYAPGSNIISCNNIGGYSSYTGTSFAAPFVTSICSIMFSAAPNMNASDIGIVAKNSYDETDKIIDAHKSTLNAVTLNYLNESNPQLANIIKSSGKLLTNEIVALLKNNNFSALSENDLDLISTHFAIKNEDLVYFYERNIDLITSIVILSSIKNESISKEKSLELYDCSGSLDEYVGLSSKVLSFIEQAKLTKEEIDDLVKAITNGNSIEVCGYTLPIASVTGIPLSECLNENIDISSITYNSNFSSELVEIALNHKADINVLNEWLNKNNKSIAHLKEKIKIWQQERNFYYHATQILSLSQQNNVENTIYNKYKMQSNDDVLNDISVSQIEGIVSYSKDLLTLKGKDGLDLNLGLRYDQDDSMQFASLKDIDDMPLKYQFEYTADWYIVDDGVESLKETNWTVDSELIDESQITEYANKAYIESKITDTCYWIYQIKSFKILAAHEGVYQEQTFLRSTFNDSRYDLGTGWAWTLPALEIRATKKILHFSDGQKYTLEQKGSTYTLKGYPYQDFVFLTAAASEFVSGSKSASYKLKYKNGRYDFFDSTGLYLGSASGDLENSARIHVYYDSENKLSYIIDSVGRKIEFVNRLCSETITDPNFGEHSWCWEEVDVNFYDINSDEPTRLLLLTKYDTGWWDSVSETQYYDSTLGGIGIYENGAPLKTYFYGYDMVDCDLSYNYAGGLVWDGETFNADSYDQFWYVLNQICETDYTNSGEPSSCYTTIIYEPSKKYISPAVTLEYGRVQKIENVEYVTSEYEGTEERRNSKEYKYYQVNTNTNEKTELITSGSWDAGSGCYWPKNEHINFQHELIEGVKLTRTYYSNERLIDKIEVYDKNLLTTPYSITEITYDNNKNPIVESTRKGTAAAKLWVINRKSYDNYGNVLTNTVESGTEMSFDGIDVEPGITYLLEAVSTEYGDNKSIPLKTITTSNLVGHEKCYVTVQENFLDKDNRKILSSINYVQNYDDPSERTYLNKIDYLIDGYNVTDTYKLDLTKNDIQSVESVKHTSFEYDAKYGLYISKNIENGAVVNSNGSLSNEETSYQYDSLGRVISGGTDASHIVSYDYDALGNILKIENPDGSNTRYNYDYINKTTEEIAPDGSKVKYVYDIFDKLDKEYRYNATTNSYDLIRDYTYDSRNRTSTLVEYMNSQTTEYKKVEYSYDFLDRPTSIIVTDHNNNLLSKQEFLYGYEELYGTLYELNTVCTYNGTSSYSTKKEYLNAAGNLCAVKKEYTSGQYYTDNYYYSDLNRLSWCDGDTVEACYYSYDNAGNLFSVSDALENTTTQEHDGFGRVISTTDAIGAETLYEYDALDRVIYTKKEISDSNEEFAENWVYYDEHGNVVATKVKDASLDSTTTYNNTLYTYDSLNNLTVIEQPLNAESSVYTQYVYDSLNSVRYVYTGLTELLTLNENGLPVETNVTYSATEYQYDQYHNISKAISDSKTESYTYDFSGNMLSSQVTNSSPVYYTYDMLGRQLTKSSDNLTESVTYNDAGQIATITDKNGTHTYTYDLLGRVLTETRNDSSDERDYKLIFTYNSKSQPLTTSLQLYDSETELYDEKDYQSYTYDALSRLSLLTFKSSVNDASASTIEYEYNAISQPTSVTVTQNDNSYQTLYSYSSGGLQNRIEQKTKVGDADYVTQHYEDYTYSTVGNLLTKTDNSGNLTQYSYDSLNRLVSESYSENTVATKQISYNYDAFNNRISKTLNDISNQSEKQTTYTYRYGTQLSSETTISVDGRETFSYNYNNAGDLISKCKIVDGVASDVTSNTYDAFGRLLSTSVTEDSVSTQTNYEYDALNHRISKTTNDDTIYHFWNGNNIVGDLTEDAYQSYVLGVTRIEALATTNNSGNRAVSAYGKNAHGDVIALQSLDGATVGNYEYDAYGNTLSATDGIYNPYGYSGEYYDEETGYYYLRARYYDPTIGSFIQKDTYSGEITSPASLNPYGYCQANPVYYSDPTGHWVETALDVVGLVADAYDFYKKPSLLNGVFLTWSIVSVVVPLIPGSYVGRAAKVAGKADDVADMYKTIKRTGDAIDAVADTAKAIKKTSSAVDKVKDLGTVAIKYVDDILEAGTKKTFKETAEKAQKKLVRKTQEAASELIQKISKSHKKVDIKFTDVTKINISEGTKFTKSNMKFGREMHSLYKTDVADSVTKFKEFVLPSKKRIDFIDFDSKTIYELKPFNPRAIKQGQKQLSGYLKEISEIYGEGWKTILEVYQ